MLTWLPFLLWPPQVYEIVQNMQSIFLNLLTVSVQCQLYVQVMAFNLLSLQVLDIFGVSSKQNHHFKLNVWI